MVLLQWCGHLLFTTYHLFSNFGHVLQVALWFAGSGLHCMVCMQVDHWFACRGLKIDHSGYACAYNINNVNLKWHVYWAHYVHQSLWFLDHFVCTDLI